MSNLIRAVGFWFVWELRWEEQLVVQNYVEQGAVDL